MPPVTHWPARFRSRVRQHWCQSFLSWRSLRQVVLPRSRDRHCHGGTKPPQRKSFRPYRNRAIIYNLIETGMRRAAAITSSTWWISILIGEFYRWWKEAAVFNHIRSAGRGSRRSRTTLSRSEERIKRNGNPMLSFWPQASVPTAMAG